MNNGRVEWRETNAIRYLNSVPVSLRRARCIPIVNSEQKASW